MWDAIANYGKAHYIFFSWFHFFLLWTVTCEYMIYVFVNIRYFIKDNTLRLGTFFCVTSEKDQYMSHAFVALYTMASIIAFNC